MATDEYGDVLSQARQLSREQQTLLLDNLRSLLASNGQQRRSMLELQGLGKDVWGGVDAQQYVDAERGRWNG